MTWGKPLTAALLGLLAASGAQAQPADLPIPAATTAEYPPGVSIAKTDRGPVYADARGRTLYGMDMRTLVRWAPDAAKFCGEACQKDWEPLLAPPGSVPNIAFPLGFGERHASTQAAPMIPNQKAPDWAVIEGAQGPQWVYKGWHVVFTRKGDRPRSASFDGADNFTWNTLKFVPPVPQLTAPANVGTALVDGAHVLADKGGRLLFTGKCTSACDAWVPLAGPMASRGLGAWAIAQTGDQPQWTYKGQPVFVSQANDPASLPAHAVLLKP